MYVVYVDGVEFASFVDFAMASEYMQLIASTAANRNITIARKDVIVESENNTRHR